MRDTRRHHRAGCARAAACDEGGVHPNLSIGMGTAYDLAGLRLEVGGSHFSGFVGIGALAAGAVTGQTLSAPGGLGFSAGVRWYREIRKGFFLSTNVTDSWYNAYYSFDEPCQSNPRVYSGSLVTATVVAGYRWRWPSGWFGFRYRARNRIRALDQERPAVS